jgi:sugar lactone lactonase YvrE
VQPAVRPVAFYPGAPAAPRIQHLVTLSSERDLRPPRSGLADFVAGNASKGYVLAQPYGAALHDGKLFVADTGAPGLAVFNLASQRLALQTGAGGGRMIRPINVSIDSDGTRYVADMGAERVLMYGRDDHFERALGNKGQFRPTDVAIAGNRLYVVDIKNHQVQVLDKSSGQVLFTIGKAGSGPGELFQPTNVAIGPDGDVYVTETGNFRVQRFTRDGAHVRFYGQQGNLPGDFARPKGLAVDRQGRIYVGDAAIQNVQIFENDGRLLMDFGRPIEGLDGLNLPAAVRLDYDNLGLFRDYASPGFDIEYLVLVVSQFGPNKVDVYGFGRMAGVNYDLPAAAGQVKGP